MFSKIIVLCAAVAVTQAGLLPAAVHYSPAEAVSSQSIVFHGQAFDTKLDNAPVAVAAPVYHATPTVYYAPAPVYHAPAAVAYETAPVETHEEEHAPAKYEFSYSVADEHTGDKKEQHETRDGDVVKGSYSFHEADGSIRTVEYSADKHSGFNAEVHNTAPTAAPAIIKAAPVVLKTPVYAAPALQYYYH